MKNSTLSFSLLKGFVWILLLGLVSAGPLTAQYNLPIQGNDAVRCGAGEVTLEVSENTSVTGNWSPNNFDANNVKWYTVPNYGTPIATGLTYTTPYIEFTQAFYVDYIGADGCSQCDRLLIQAVIADQVITPNIVYPSIALCNNTNSNFTPTIVGSSAGEFSVSPSSGLVVNATTGAFNPAGATAGQYVITYAPEAVTGCNSNAVSVTITITQAPSIPTIAYAPSNYCSSSAPVSVTQTGPSGGFYTVSPSSLTVNASTGEITPATSATGSYTVTYTVPGSGGCAPVSGSTDVDILKLPTASISYPAASFTQNQGAQLVTLTGTDDYTGGTFSASPTVNPGGIGQNDPSPSLNIDANTGTIDPSQSDAGTYTVTYTKAAVSPCATNLVATTTVSIFGLPSATIASDVTDVCLEGTDPVVTFTGTGGQYPYTFTYQIGSGPSFDITTTSGSSVTLNHSTLIAGTYVYKILSVTDDNSSTRNYVSGSEPSVSINVNTPLTASFEYTGTPYCSDASDPTPVLLNNSTAGTFSSTNGLTFLSTSTGEVDLSASTAGTYTVTNTIAATGGCPQVSADASLTITRLSITGFSYANASYCQLDTDPTVVLDQDAEHGLYSSDPIGILFLANGGVNLDESEAQAYTIYNTVAASGGCPQVQSSTSLTITPEVIISTPVFNAGAATSRCQAGETLDIYGATSTGSASITYSYALDAASIAAGNSINNTTGAVTWSATFYGSATITVTASAPCAQDKTASHEVTVNQSGALDTPTFTLGATSTRCQSNETVAYTLSNVNGNYNYTYVLDATSIAGGNVSFSFENDVDWVDSWYGTSTLTVTANSGCSSSPAAVHTITTNPAPAIPTGTDVTSVYNGSVHTGSASSQVNLLPSGSEAAAIVWYGASSGGTSITAPSGTDVGSYTAYAEGKSNTTNCVSLERTLVTVTITQRPLTANSTLNDKTYDGSPATGSIVLGTVSNYVGQETLTITTSSTDFATNIAESDKASTISYTLADGLNGGKATNYSMADKSVTGTINKLQLTIADPTITKTKEYDTQTSAVVTAGALQNVVSGDVVSIDQVTAVYDNANVGTGKTITVSYTITGANAGNYLAPINFTVNDGEITAKNLTVSGAVAADKTYDATNTATVDFTNASLVGVLNSDDVSINHAGYAATFAQATIGSDLAVTVTGVSLSGTKASNYTVSQPSGLLADINAASLTITADDYAKGYGVTLTSPTTGSTAFTVGANQLKGSDEVTSVTLTYLNDVETAAKAVGTYTESIEPSAAQGTGLSNYTITYVKGDMSIYEIIVESSTGTAQRAGYNSLYAAYTAINGGTLHTGDVTVNIYANTTETQTATLNADGTGSTSYNSVSIVPQTNVTITGDQNVSPVMILGSTPNP